MATDGPGNGAVTTSLAVLRARRDGHLPEAPPAASARAYLRDGLPAVYREHEFGMRFLGALELTLDPLVALLDNLGAHFDPDLATGPMIEIVSAWLGVELDESWPLERRRELVRRFGDLAPRRGTQRGLELLLAIAFPDLPMRIEDAGRVSHASDPDGLAGPGSAGFVLYCDVPVGDEQAARIARLVDQARPVHVPWRLRVRRAAEGAS